MTQDLSIKTWGEKSVNGTHLFNSVGTQYKAQIVPTRLMKLCPPAHLDYFGSNEHQNDSKLSSLMSRHPEHD